MGIILVWVISLQGYLQEQVKVGALLPFLQVLFASL
jgi:hypothetical protein